MRQALLLPGVSLYNIFKKIEKTTSNLAAQVSIKQNCKERKLFSLRSGFAAATPSSVLGCFHLLLQYCTSEQCVNQDSQVLQLQNSCI